jgi:hypothetical protein
MWSAAHAARTDDGFEHLFLTPTIMAEAESLSRDFPSWGEESK